MRQVRVWACGLALSAALAGACNNVPTLPLPPPVVIAGSPDERGLALVEGKVNPRAFVYVFNERIESGVIMRSDVAGRFSVEIEAAVADVLTVWQDVDGQQGERTETVVPRAR